VNDKKIVYVEKEAMPDDAQFIARITEEYQRNKNATVVLKGDARLTYGDVKKVMLKVKEVGFEQVGLITQRQES
jgi:biopolymer transport protein ExbD